MTMTHYPLPASRIPGFRVPILLALLALAPLPARADEEPVPREVQFAVDRGLEWLAKNQQSSGTWSSGPINDSATAATTSLATMAFMARGYTPGQGPYGDNINRGVDAILNLQGRDGLIAQSAQNPAMYDHGISTVALCEAFGMLDEPRQKRASEAISRAVRVILDAQRVPKSANNQGGWRYSPDSRDSDTSVSGWQLMALRGARNIGANLPQKAIDDGIEYIKQQAVPAAQGGGFGYTGPGSPNVALTGTGILALSLMGQPNAPEVRAGADYLLRQARAPFGSHYYYTIYYVSQAAWQLGGNYWSEISRRLNADILAKRKSDGHWDGEVNPSYCTAMALLALSVPYRYLPIYQR